MINHLLSRLLIRSRGRRSTRKENWSHSTYPQNDPVNFESRYPVLSTVCQLVLFWISWKKGACERVYRGPRKSAYRIIQISFSRSTACIKYLHILRVSSQSFTANPYSQPSIKDFLVDRTSNPSPGRVPVSPGHFLYFRGYTLYFWVDVRIPPPVTFAPVNYQRCTRYRFTVNSYLSATANFFLEYRNFTGGCLRLGDEAGD